MLDVHVTPVADLVQHGLQGGVDQARVEAGSGNEKKRRNNIIICLFF